MAASSHPAGPPLQNTFFLYGPPGSGKSTLGAQLSRALKLPLLDLDAEIERRSGMSIPEIFAREGEPGFRDRERRLLKTWLGRKRRGVIVLGGGALLDPASRREVEAAGPVLCLSAPFETLLARLQAAGSPRPLLSTAPPGAPPSLEGRLGDLLEKRAGHYASFPLQLDTASGSPEQLVWEAQISLGRFHVQGMGRGYDVRVQNGSLDLLGPALAGLGLGGPLALVSDENVGRLYAGRVAAALDGSGFTVQTVLLAPGEQHKTVAAVERLWEAFIQAGLERGSPVVALGGGVVGDLAGFAAATYLRGIPWVVVPTSLLGMADASLGGKTAADLPQGKNLVGAFHPPRLVLVDPQVLGTLPELELRAGMAEVVKSAIIGDPALFERCSRGWQEVRSCWDLVVRRAMAVKIRVIQADPYEKGPRAALNLGHTIAHALEMASGFSLRHGEAVSIGLAAEARLAEQLGIAAPGLAERIAACLEGLGLPTELPAGLNRAAFLSALRVEKKRLRGKVRFALPVRIGEVRVGVEVDNLDAVLAEEI